MTLGTLAALEQRITVRRTMTGMTGEETAGYIRHHLQLGGRSDPLFTDDAIALIHDSGRGKPCGVNRLAISALIAACVAGNPVLPGQGNLASGWLLGRGHVSLGQVLGALGQHAAVHPDR